MCAFHYSTNHKFAEFAVQTTLASNLASPAMFEFVGVIESILYPG